MRFRWIAGCVAIAGALALASARGEPLRTIRVANDRAPDCSSLESLVASVTRECRTDDERAIAIYNVCRYLYYHHAYPSEPGGIGALKMINVYGWSLCGGQHSVLAALWEKAGFRWRYRGWSDPGHTTVECFYGGRWHYLDTFLKFYVWMPDPSAAGGRTIAGQEDIRANPALAKGGLVMDEARKVAYHPDDRFELIEGKANWTASAFLVCGDTLDGILSGIASSRDAGSPRGWGSISFDEPDYSTSVDLAPGYALTLDWDKIEDAYSFRGMKRGPFHSCGDKDYRNCPAIGPILEPYAGKDRRRTWSNGTLLYKPDLRAEGGAAGLLDPENLVCEDGLLEPKDASRPGSFVIEMASPYVVAKAWARIACEDAKIELSLDGKGWKPVAGEDLTAEVAGCYRYRIRVAFRSPISAIEVASIVQHNQEALPYLAPGRNRIEVGAANPEALASPRGRNHLVVTYAYAPGSRHATPEEICARGAEIARAHFASWSDAPVVVQKVFESLPATFEILVPTPKGKEPVYPRMLFLRREVLAPGQAPLPVPAPPSTPSVGPEETLATLPNPWLIGCRPRRAAARTP